MIDRTEKQRLLIIFHFVTVLYERLQYSAALIAYAIPDPAKMVVLNPILSIGIGSVHP